MTTVALFLMTSVNSQNTRFGFKAGPNSNVFYLKSEGTGGSDSRYSLTKPGFHVGGVVDLGISENFSIQPQLLFNMKGGKITLSGTETDFTFYTIDLPINLLYRHAGFFAGGGPNISYGVSAKGKATGGTEEDLYESTTLGGKFNRFEFGVNGTMGYQFESGFTLATNYTPGLSDIFKENSGTTGTIKSHNSAWSFSIGYVFGGSKPSAKKK